MVYFVGAGCGAVDLITIRGAKLLRLADLVIYAGSLVNPDILDYCGPETRLMNSAEMTLEDVLEAILDAEAQNKRTVRLHSGDSSLYGAIREQMVELDKRGIEYEVVPGVSSMNGAAAALRVEYTLPGVSQSVIVTRMAGRTPVPSNESIAAFAAHHTSMVIFLSAGMMPQLQQELLAGGYSPSTHAAIAYKVSWPDERIVHCTVGSLAATGAEHNMTKTALILVGDFLDDTFNRSLLYSPHFSTMFRKGDTDAH